MTGSESLIDWKPFEIPLEWRQLRIPYCRDCLPWRELPLLHSLTYLSTNGLTRPDVLSDIPLELRTIGLLLRTPTCRRSRSAFGS
ncbi:MAG: hypothetical protein ACR2JB_05975 [Bryobacteraceae bacterium]